jgi:hypothetical protein
VWIDAGLAPPAAGSAGRSVAVGRALHPPGISAVLIVHERANLDREDVLMARGVE